ncbi:MAG: DUF2721 domain-containing protein [Bdellovibrionota bacterium]
MDLASISLVQNPFTVVTIIAAPAILTNASSVLSLSTSTRFMKCIDRIHQFNLELDKPHSPEVKDVLVRQIELSHTQSRYFLSALRSIYTSLGAFALASLLALIGASTTTLISMIVIETVATISLICGGIGAAGFLLASYYLIRASNIANVVIGADMATMLKHKELALLKNL